MSESEKPAEATPPPAAHGHHAPVDPTQPVNPDFTDSDIHLATVRKFMFGSLAVTLVFFVLMLIVHTMYKKSFTDKRGIPEGRQIPRADQALLQTKPLEGLLEYKALEEQRLTQTTNVGPHAVIRPEAAMQIMLEEGAFPTPGPKPAAPIVEAPAIIAQVQPEPAAPALVAQAPVAPQPAVQAPAPAAQANSSLDTRTSSLPSPPDPAMVAAGKVIYETACIICHTGKKGAIGPNILNAYGTMRNLENREPILMDEAYILNSMINPNEHIAKGYMPAMSSFKESFTDTQRKQVAAYLMSQGKPIPAPAPVVVLPEPSAPAVVVPEPAPVVVAEPAPAPALVMPIATPAPEVVVPPPAPTAAPVAPPEPAPAPKPTPSYIFI